MFVTITNAGERALKAQFHDRCLREGCSQRVLEPTSALVRLAAIRVISITILMLCSVIIGSMLTLFVHAQTVGEKVAVIESKQVDMASDLSQISGDINNMRAEIKADRDFESAEISELKSKVGIITGVGLAIGGLVSVLQVIMILIKNIKRQP